MVESEYDLRSLELIETKGREISMYVTPRFRDYYGSPDYEKMTASFLVRLLSSADLFIDVGAHYGFFSLIAGSAYPSLPIVALEPTPASYEILRRNVAYGRHKHIDARQLAVSSEQGEKSNFIISVLSDNCSFYEHPHAPPIDRIEVETVSIDALLTDRSAKTVVVKIDTDGHEIAVLAGMSESLRRGLDLRLVIEFNPKMQRQAGFKPEELLQQLDMLGFAMFVIDDDRGRFYRLRPEEDWTAMMNPASYANIYCIGKERALSVLFFSHSSQLGGAERSLLELVDELVSDYGAVCTVVAPGPGPLVEKLSRSGAATILASLPWWTMAPGTPREDVLNMLVQISQSLCRELMPQLTIMGADVVFTQTMVIPWGTLAASILGKPHVWSVCEYGERDHGVFFLESVDGVIAAVKRCSSLILTNCNAIRDEHFGDVDPDRVRTVYRHIPIPNEMRPSSALWRRKDSIKLGLFGSICEGKGQLEAVNAVIELLRRGRDVELLLAGFIADERYHARLQSLIETMDISDRVTIAGFLADPLPAMAASDIVLSCSRREAFGRSVVEAMLLERPVVYARTGGLVEYLEDRKTGLAYTPGKVDELVRCIEKIIDDRVGAVEIGKAAKRSAQQRFSRDAYGGAVFSLLKRLREESGIVAVPHCILNSLAKAVLDDSKEIAARDAALAQLRSEIAARDVALGQLRAEIAARDVALGELHSEIAARDAALERWEAYIAECAAVLAQRNADISALRQQLVTVQTSSMELEATLHELRASTSWRVTAPLRMIKRRFN